MGILWEDRGWDDYLYWQTQDKKTLYSHAPIIPLNNCFA